MLSDLTKEVLVYIIYLIGVDGIDCLTPHLRDQTVWCESECEKQVLPPSFAGNRSVVAALKHIKGLCLTDESGWYHE